MHGQSESEATSSVRLKNSFMRHEFQHLFQEGITSAAEGSFHTPHIHALFSSLISDYFFFCMAFSFFGPHYCYIIIWRTFVLIYFLLPFYSILFPF